MPVSFFAISGLINGVAAVIFGAFVYLKNRSGLTNKITLIFSGSTAFWAFSYFIWLTFTHTAESALFWTRMLSLGSTLIPLGFFHWIIALTNQQKKYKAQLIIAYLVSFFFLFFTFSSLMVASVEPKLQFPFWPNPGLLYNFYLSFCYLGLPIYAFFILLKAYRQSKDIEREKFKYVFLGTFFGWVGGVSNFFLWYNVPFPPYTNLFIVLYPIIFTYAIVRYRLMNIRFVFSKTLLYFLLILCAAASFLLVTLAVSHFFDVNVQNTLLVTSIAAVIVVLILTPLKKFITSLSEKIFFTSPTNYQDLIKRLSHIISSEIDLDRLISSISTSIIQTLQVNKSEILLLNPQDQTFCDRSGKMCLKDEDNIIQYFKKEKQTVISYELEDILKNTSSQHIDIQSIKCVLSEVKKLKSVVAIPIFGGENDNKLVAVFLIGGKLNSEIFSLQDLQLFSVITSQLGLALEKSRLYDETKQFNSKLKKEVAKATQELRQAYDKLKHLDDAKTEFISITSHQLRTPLSGLRSGLSMLLEGDYGKLSKKTHSAIENLYKNSHRLMRLVNTFLNISRIETNRLTATKKKIDLVELINSVINELKGEVKKKGLNLEFKPPQNKIIIQADVIKLSDALVNLFDNAIKYTSIGKIIIKLKKDKKQIKFELTDSGIGFSPAESKKLFDKFSRSPAAIKIYPDGSGLGMYISKKIIEAHGGKIWATSPGKNKGSTFGFSLPV